MNEIARLLFSSTKLLVSSVVLLMLSVVLLLTSCTSTYSITAEHQDGSVVRTDITVSNGIGSTIGEPEFMRVRAEYHYSGKDGHFLGGRECEQVFQTLLCKPVSVSLPSH